MQRLAAQAGRAAGPGAPPRQRYSGWLDVVQTTVPSLNSYCSESVVEFPGGWAELQRFSWSTPLESIWHTGERCYYFSLSLNGPNETSRRNIAHASAGRCGGPRVLLVPPQQTISSTSPASGQRRVLRCLLHADLVDSIIGTPPDAEERAALGAMDFSGRTIEWLLFRMYREVSAAELGMTVAIESIARGIAVETARTVARRRELTRHRTGGLAPWRLRLIIDRIQMEAPLPTAAELADVSGMTVRHLGRAFQFETGKTLGKYIAAVMAERACKMLTAGAPIGTVASALGYASSSSFAQAFRRETGVLPSSVRAGPSN